MKRIATMVDGDGRVVGLVHGPEACEQKIAVKGRTWTFDFDEHLGPLWLRKDGSARKSQCPGSAVWSEFEKWHKRYLRKRMRNQQ